MEERKQELVGLISKQQDDKLRRVRSLIRRHSGELEAAVTLVESAIRSTEDPHMSAFIQVGVAMAFLGRGHKYNLSFIYF